VESYANADTGKKIVRDVSGATTTERPADTHAGYARSWHFSPASPVLRRVVGRMSPVKPV